jgi:four helix bundle protein
VEVYQVTKGFPREELYGLTSQLRRAAVPVPANIAEGSQRQYLKEYLQFLYTAKASMSEAEYYVHLAQQLSYLRDAEFESVTAIQTEGAKTLYGLFIGWRVKSPRARSLRRTSTHNRQQSARSSADGCLLTADCYLLAARHYAATGAGCSLLTS